MPPLAIGRTPVTPVVSGSPVAFVSVTDDGVPSAGVTNVGDVAKTMPPEPVTFCPSAVATPVPNEVIPVPPLAIFRVPATVMMPWVAVAGVNPVVPNESETTASADTDVQIGVPVPCEVKT